MKRKMYRIFLDFEKEEAWLNSLAAKGWNMVAFTFGAYTFERGTPGEYTYRIELLENLPFNLKSQSYIEFMEDSGVECVDTHARWVYFRKKSADGPFSVYSDHDSKIKHYQRIALMFGVIAMVNFIMPTANILHSPNVFWGTDASGIPVVITMLNYLIFLSIGSKAFQYYLKIRRLNKEKILHE